MRKSSTFLLVASVCIWSIILGWVIATKPWTKQPTQPEPHWLPTIHHARLIDMGALDFVDRNLSGIEPGTGWVDVVSGIVYLDLDDSGWATCALIHEASHVQQYRDGLQYYGANAEAMADHATRVFCPDWVQRMPWQIPDNGPVGDNPEVTNPAP